MSDSWQNSQRSGGTGENAALKSEHLDSMSADELLVRMESELDATTDHSYDDKQMDAYLAALDSKRPLQSEFDVSSSWSKFREQHAVLFEDETFGTGKKITPGAHLRHIRMWLPRIAAAVLITIVCMIGVQAAGIDIFGALGRWTKDIFQFAPSGASAEAETMGNGGEVEHSSHSSIQEALDAYNISDKLVPTWFPEGYECKSVSCYRAMNDLSFVAIYANDKGNITVSIEELVEGGGSAIYEKDEADPILYIGKSDRARYYILSNLDSTTIAWRTDRFESVIVGPFGVEDAKQIIDSIK